jgi:hypothetical protein
MWATGDRMTSFTQTWADSLERFQLKDDKWTFSRRERVTQSDRQRQKIEKMCGLGLWGGSKLIYPHICGTKNLCEFPPIDPVQLPDDHSGAKVR